MCEENEVRSEGGREGRNDVETERRGGERSKGDSGGRRRHSEDRDRVFGRNDRLGLGLNEPLCPPP